MILISTSQSAAGQQQFLANDTIYKWQVGLNLYPHVKADELFEYALRPRKDYLQVTFPVEFLVRKQYTLDKAFRLRLMGVFENFQDKDFNAADQDTKRRSLSIALGHEWQQVIGKRWEWYYGAEVQVRRAIWQATTIDDMYYWSQIDEIVWLKREFEGVTDRLSLLPFLGVRFQITPRLFVNSEIKIELFRENYDYTSFSTFIDISNDQALPSGRGSDFNFNQSGLRLLPYTGLFINIKL